MIKKHKLKGTEIPAMLNTIPSAPKELFIIGDGLEEALARPRIAVVGSRKITSYGRAVTEDLATKLASHGVAIISGLALGVDGCAHQATLNAGGLTIAVLPCGLDKIYPRTHYGLAQQIIKQGGALVSEYSDGMPPRKENFIARNRLVAGLADGVLITEAAQKSGTLHTVNFALAQGKPVFVVPGNITSPQSAACNQLIKTGAIPVTEVADILSELGISEKTQTDEITASSPEEHAILTLISNGVSDGHQLLTESKLPADSFNQAMTLLEISGRIKPLGNNHWAKQ